MTAHTLVVRLDSMGDVLISGPAVRAVAAGSQRVTLLTGPLGESAGRLLPGVDDVLVWACPWIVNPAPPVSPADIAQLTGSIAGLGVDRALILTSFHQSALPTALLLRLAGVAAIYACSEDYPGSLLDRRIPDPPDGPEPERMLAIARAAGFDLAAGDDGRLAVAGTLPTVELGLPARYLVLHPGVTAPARAYPDLRWAETVAALSGAGWPLVITGSASERQLTARLAAAASGAPVLDLAGVLDLPELAAVLASAAAVVVANTGPAHLAAAVGTPVVSLFAPVVPATRWAPYGVAVSVLGDQSAACRQTRSVICPIAGHPCLNSVSAQDILAAVRARAGSPLTVSEVSA